jgi:hypothetical protein
MEGKQKSGSTGNVQQGPKKFPVASNAGSMRIKGGVKPSAASQTPAKPKSGC